MKIAKQDTNRNAPFFDVQHVGQETPYLDVQAMQEQAVADVLAGGREKLFFVEHAPVYTAGSSAVDADYLGVNQIPVIKTGRGGKLTYHGPGQRVVYPIIDLRPRGRDLRKYIASLQNWLIESLAEFGIKAFTNDDVGVWVNTPRGDEKIAAIGVRVRKWIAFHGIALNVHPDLEHFKGIIPCGIVGKGVTSMEALGVKASLEDVDKVLLEKFTDNFGGLSS
jgi:lipoyl(octanoyl) transferase